jgi:RNA polymerase sigma-70 factor (ECF subfamily)
LDAETEKNLVASSRKGDRQAYADLVRAHCRRVFAICFGMLGNRHDAEDVAQQTLLRGLMQIRTLRHSERFGPWIAAIARNLCIDAIRRSGRSTPPPAGMDAKERIIDSEDCRRLETALAKLSSDYRVPLLLFYFDGRSTASIGQTLGMSQAAVQTRLSRARRQLRELLGNEGGEP